MKRIMLVSVLLGVASCGRDEGTATTGRKPMDDRSVPASTKEPSTPSGTKPSGTTPSGTTPSGTTPSSQTPSDASAKPMTPPPGAGQDSAMSDEAITAMIREKMMLDDQLKPVATKVDVVTKDGVVTLVGPATAAEELAIVEIAENAKGVKRVENKLEAPSEAPSP